MKLFRPDVAWILSGRERTLRPGPDRTGAKNLTQTQLDQARGNDVKLDPPADNQAMSNDRPRIGSLSELADLFEISHRCDPHSR